MKPRALWNPEYWRTVGGGLFHGKFETLMLVVEKLVHAPQLLANFVDDFIGHFSRRMSTDRRFFSILIIFIFIVINSILAVNFQQDIVHDAQPVYTRCHSASKMIRTGVNVGHIGHNHVTRSSEEVVETFCRIMVVTTAVEAEYNLPTYQPTCLLAAFSHNHMDCEFQRRRPEAFSLFEILRSR
ncbi:hypothetical protein C8J56DRAFT_1073337, partial [Mycena floridula]